MYLKIKKYFLFALILLYIFSMVFVNFSVYATDQTDEMNRLVKNYPYSCAVLLCDTEGETLYSHKADNMFDGASLIKLPYAVFVCTQIMEGIHELDETITYTSKWYHGGSGIIRTKGYEKNYTISQLLDYSLRYSDNVAYDMLVYLFGVKGFNSMVDGWGYNIHLSAGVHFPMLNASFMKTAMEEMQKHKSDGECWKVCWKALTESVDVYTRDAITDKYEVAVKFGQVTNVYHETSYIDADTPYILVIMTSIKNFYPDTTFLKNVCSCAEKIVQEKYPPLINEEDKNILIKYSKLSLKKKRKSTNSFNISFILNLYSHISTGGNMSFRDFIDFI